jgi:uncharacterized protein YqgC (DUF456 family)
LDTLLYLLGALALLAGLAGVALPGLPGAPLMVAGVALLAWAGHFATIGWPTVIAAAVIGLVMMAVDFIAGALGARAFGGSKWALLGASLGFLVGLFLGLPGILLGPAVGAIALEYAKDPNFERALKAGGGVFVGFLAGTVAKIALAFVLVGVVLLALVF